MAKRYIRINFANRPSTVSPVTATNLNKLDKGIDDCDNAIEDLYIIKFDKANITGQSSTNDANKVPSSQVTYAQGQAIEAINNNLLTKVPLSTTSIDPNTVTYAQCFYMSGINAPSFFPNDHSGYCICFAFNNDYCTQFAMSFFGSKIAYRSRAAGVWDEWTEK